MVSMRRNSPKRSWHLWCLSVCALFLLGLLIVYPITSVLLSSFSPKGVVSLTNYSGLFHSSKFTKLFCQSILVSAGSASIATLFGTVLAILVIKTASPVRKFVAFIAVLPIILPGFVTSIAYIFLFGRNGLLTYKLLNISWDVYSWKSVLILQSIDQTTTAFLMVAAALGSLGSKPEEAAKTLGAEDWRILWQITLRLVQPMIFGAFLLNFIAAMGDFSTPLIVGGPFDTLASASYTELIGKYNISMAATYNIALLLIAMLVFYGYNHFTSGKNDQLSWRSGTAAPLNLDGFRGIILRAIAAVFITFVLLLSLAVILAAFTKRSYSSTSFTLEYFSIIRERGFSSTIYTIVFSLCVGVITAFFGQVLAYLIQRIRIPANTLIDFIATIPFALPGTLIGVGYAIAFNRPPLLLTGTWFIIVMNLVVRKMPLGIRTGTAILQKQDSSLDEAANLLGASQLRTFFSVNLPLLKTSILVCSLYAFVTTIQALGSIIFIITPGTKLLSVDVFEAVIKGELGVAAAYSFIMLLIGIIGGTLIYITSTRNQH
jgi:iron(III) transport system permease protein